MANRRDGLIAAKGGPLEKGDYFEASHGGRFLIGVNGDGGWCADVSEDAFKWAVYNIVDMPNDYIPSWTFIRNICKASWDD